VSATSVIVRLARDVRTALDQQLAAHDLTSQQAGVLIHAYTVETSPRRIGDLLGTDTAGMTRLLDRLEAKGLIRREPDPDDRRAIVVALTDRGTAIIPQLPPVFERVGAILGADIPEADIQTTLHVLQAMLQNLHEDESHTSRSPRRPLPTTVQAD
jgi:DNA-binding MarR family transcriptional regulator